MQRQRELTNAIICFVPLIAAILLFVYQYHLMGRVLITGRHRQAMQQAEENFSTLTVMYGAVATLMFLVLAYMVINVVGKDLPKGRKIMWILALAIFMPISFPIYWYTQGKK